MNKKAQIFSVPAKGNSMYPILQSGDRVEYIQTPFSNIRLNDIVIVYSNKIFVTHRVIYKTSTTCITRGDNNRASDGEIKKERILGKVVRFKRNGVWHDIQEVYRIQSALYLHEIQKLETVLRLHKVPHVFLKGVLISLRYEGTIPKRIYADCDILVKRYDQKNIEKVFKMLGYQLQERALWQPQRLPSRQTIKPEVSFVKIVSGVPVVFDVHFEPVFLMTQLGGMNMLYPSTLLTLLGDNIINRGERKKIRGFSYSLCSPPDQILYLALHIFHHNFTDSMRYQLLDSVIRKSALLLRSASGRSSNLKKGLPPFGSAQGKLSRYDIWEELVDMIKVYRLEGYVYGVFILLKKYFKTPIPPSFFRSICPSRFALHVLRFAIQRIDIFSQDSRAKAGITRFILIFLLSPNPLVRKFLIFIHKDTLVMGIRLMWGYFSTIFSLKNNTKSHNYTP